MLRILLGTDWVTLRDRILSMVSRDVKAKRGGRILMVPELISHDTERRLCAAAGDSLSLYAEVLSFTRLARRVAEQMGGTAEGCMDGGGRLIAMAAAARQLSSRLKAYAAVETRPEFLSAMVEAVDEFKRCRILPEDLLRASGQTEGALAQKLEELSLLLGAYDALCENGRRDPRDQMNVLLEQLADGDFAENHVFYIDGFPDFSRQHLAVLEQIIRVSPSVTVGLNCDRPGSRQMAFETAGQTALDLLNCARQAGVEAVIETVEPALTPVSMVPPGLFQGKTEPCGALEALRADSLHHEVELIAERITGLVRAGCRYRDIGVVYGDPTAYRDVVSQVFGRFGIPEYRSGKENVLQKTVVSALVDAMEAALGGFEQRDVLRYLRSVLSPLSMDVCDRVENYAFRWNIQGTRWAKEWEYNPQGLSAQWTDARRNELRELNKARALAMEPLLRLSDGFRQAANLAGQIRAVYRFLEDIGLSERLEELAGELEKSGELRDAQILNQLWDILMTAMEQMYDVLGQTVWEPEVFTRAFRLLLSQYDVGTIPPVLDAVTVGAPDAMRCQQVKHLFVLGMTEGVMPSYGGASGLLTDQERNEVRKLGLPLNGSAVESLKSEFAEIYGVFCGARETITVSCPAGQCSYVYRRLAQMAGIEREVTPLLGPALTNRRAAGALLAGRHDAAAARALGLEEQYRDTRCHADFALGDMDRRSVTALYGQTLKLSASQVDQQAECRMAYFLKYGIKAKECKVEQVDAAQFGTYIHAVLENTARDVMEKGGFHAVSLEETMEIALAHAENYRRENFSSLESQRSVYLFQRNRRELEMVVRELWQELSRIDFAPRAFELDFGFGGGMDAITIQGKDMKALLKGFVDRVDIWEKDGNHYFRVVDYKSGKKDFDYTDIATGVGLQMLLYLFALRRRGQDVVGDNPIAAGVQYFPARAPLLSVDSKLTEEEADAKRRSDWKRKGLLLEDQAVLDAMAPNGDLGVLGCKKNKDGSVSGDLADREQLKALECYVLGILEKMVDEIASGSIAPNPYTRGTSHDACRYCPYGTVCRTAGERGRRDYKAMKPEEFWTQVGKENSHG